MSDEPVIVTHSTSSPTYEQIILDFDQPTKTQGQGDTKSNIPSGSVGNAMLEAMKSSLLTKLAAWKEERFQSFRPMNEFCNRENVALPAPTDILNRVTQNLTWYQTNYLAVLCFLSLYCALTSPMFLISLILASGMWIWSMKYRVSPFKIQNIELPENVITVLLVTTTMLIFYIADAISILLWIVVISAIFAIVHALLLVPQPRDEFGFGVHTGAV